MTELEIKAEKIYDEINLLIVNFTKSISQSISKANSVNEYEVDDQYKKAIFKCVEDGKFKTEGQSLIEQSLFLPTLRSAERRSRKPKCQKT